MVLYLFFSFFGFDFDIHGRVVWFVDGAVFDFSKTP